MELGNDPNDILNENDASIKKEFFKGFLRHNFTEDQINIISTPLIADDYFDQTVGNEVLKLAHWIIRLWVNKKWTDSIVEDYQTQIMIDPKLEGVREVFKDHPEIQRLFYNNPPKSEDISYSLTYNSEYFSCHNANNNNNVKDDNLPSEITKIKRPSTPRPRVKGFGSGRLQFRFSAGPILLLREKLNDLNSYHGFATRIFKKIDWDSKFYANEFDYIRGIDSKNASVTIRVHFTDKYSGVKYRKDLYIPEGALISLADEPFPSYAGELYIEILPDKTNDSYVIGIVGAIVKPELLDHGRTDPYRFGFIEDFKNL